MDKKHPSIKIKLKSFMLSARDSARRGGRTAMRYFQKDLKVITKVDRSPVTRADREAEQVIRRFLAKRFPGHVLCGEEFGWDAKKTAPFKWWIDPVDGTRLFIRGIPFWGTLVALEHAGKVIAGAMDFPAMGLTIWAAQGMGCFANGKRIHVSKIARLSKGTLMRGRLRLFSRAQQKQYARLASSSYDDRAFCDCYAHALVILGKAEVMVEAEIKPYDVAAIKICLEEAGGRFTNLKGEPTIYGPGAISSNGRVHTTLLRAFGRI